MIKEAQFLRERGEYWKKFESEIRSGSNTDPDKLAASFIELTDDLAYSKTFYPGSNTTSYLNGLTLLVHQRIYKNKRSRRAEFVKFWMERVPLAVYRARGEMLISLLLLLLAVLIGIVSLAYDEAFAELILGRAYLNETQQNIARGDPMGIYASESEIPMFFGITMNNIGVSFRVLVSGLLTGIMSGFYILYNGIMLGCFQYYFFAQDLGVISMQAVWIHGTIEITAIVIAGGAGISWGNSWIFPGTHSRMTAFSTKGKQAVMIIAGLIPFFVIAGLLESFVTRYYQNTILSLFCIGASLLLVGWYFVYLPYKTNRDYEQAKI